MKVFHGERRKAGTRQKLGHSKTLSLFFRNNSDTTGCFIQVHIGCNELFSEIPLLVFLGRLGEMRVEHIPCSASDIWNFTIVFSWTSLCLSGCRFLESMAHKIRSNMYSCHLLNSFNMPNALKKREVLLSLLYRPQNWSRMSDSCSSPQRIACAFI